MFVFSDEVITSTTQFWAVIALFATLLAYLIRSEYNRWRDKKTEMAAAVKRELDRKAEQKERIDAENRVRVEREQIAAKIRDERRETEETVRKELERNATIIARELQLHYDREILEQQKIALEVKTRLGEQSQVVSQLDNKIVTLVKAEEHTEKIVGEVIKGAKTAEAAFEVANTINLKLEKMSESGLLNQKQEAGRSGIDEVEVELKPGEK